MVLVHLKSARVPQPGSRKPSRGNIPQGRVDALQRNKEQIRVIDVGPLIVGKPLIMLLDLRADGVSIVRTTHEVVSVACSCHGRTWSATASRETDRSLPR